MMALETKIQMTLSSSLDSNETKRKLSSTPRLLTEELFAEKHVLRIKAIFVRIDLQKKIYPNGLLTKLKEDDEPSKGTTVKRIELFSENRQSKQVHGIIRNFFLGFSHQRDLIDLANFSNWVISIRALSKDRNRNTSEDKVIEDRLVLKTKRDIKEVETSKILSAEAVMPGLNSIPSLYVSSRWLDKVNLSSGDRVLVSNPVESYATPPPEIAKEN